MSQTECTDFAFRVFAIILLALLPFACTISLDKQAEADYQKCLSWKADGYDVYCNKGEYK